MQTSCSRSQSLRFLLTLTLALSPAAISWPRPQRAASTQAPDKPAAAAAARAETEKRARDAFGKLGVSFEENRGQSDARVRFLSRGGGATVFLADDGASFVLSAPQAPASDSDKGRLRDKGSPEALARRGRSAEIPERPKSHAVRMKFEGANPRAEVSGERELEGKVNYLRGSDPSKWQTNVRTYGAVRYRGLYEGVDLVYYGNAQGRMEYDFVVAPGADAGRISLKIEGAKALKVDAAGDLLVSTPAGEMRQRRPVVYQEVGGAKREVEGGYALEAGGRVRFKLGQYDDSAPLVIDPVLEYSKYLGGFYQDYGYAVAADSAGNAYVTGTTQSTDFPTANALQDKNHGNYDVFVTKINADGSALVYSTYLGGHPDDEGHGIAVDSAGNAYITGQTLSLQFPPARPIQRAPGGAWDAFVTKLNSTGSALVYSTYLGGNSDDHGSAIAIDPAGNAYVTGYTYSTNFPTVNAIQGAHTSVGEYDAFVTKINAAGSAFIYSTYLGGNGQDQGYGIAADAAGSAYVTGYTASTDFPTVNAIQGAHTSGDLYDAFVTKFSADGTEFVYSTYLGGASTDRAYGIAADAAGSAYVTGYTASTDFPTANPFQGTGGGDAFVTKLNAAGSALVYSTYLGGSNYDVGRGIAVDSAGNAYVTGDTHSTDFPTKADLQVSPGGVGQMFVAKLKAAGSALAYSTYFGDRSTETAYGIAVDSAGNAYVTGESNLEPRGIAFVVKIGYRSISGRVVTQGAAGVAGVPWVTVRLTGTQTLSTLTDARGYYSFPDVDPRGGHVITPSKTNLSFAPASRTYADLDANLTGVNFTVPSLSVNNVTVTEGDAGEATATFTVRLQPAGGKTVTVNYQTIDGAVNPAAAGTDYAPLPSTQLTFAPGETVKTVSVTVTGDALDEAAETFKLRLTFPANAIVADGIGVCTITDDD